MKRTREKGVSQKDEFHNIDNPEDGLFEARQRLDDFNPAKPRTDTPIAG